VKHAGATTLERISPLLEPLRADGRLVERTPGCFYRKSKAFLHFHEHGEQVFADARLDDTGFTRFDVSERAAQLQLLADLRRLLQA
jgi:hypothetical protein